MNADTVRLLAEKARALSAAVNQDYEDGREHEVELGPDARARHSHDGLAEEEGQDLSEEEFRELIADLNQDEGAELVAIAWIGRGDYDAAEWAQAVADARGRVNRRLATYLLNMPMLGDYLDDGLAALGA